MSILLDAVNRKKQQQENIVDVILTPRANYSPPPKISANTRKFTLLALSIAFGVGAAWSMSLLLHPAVPSVQTVALPVERYNAPLSVADTVAVAPPTLSADAVAANGSRELPRGNQSAIDQGHDGVRLAGKVALPIAQPLAQNSYQSLGTLQRNVENTAAEPMESGYQSASDNEARNQDWGRNDDAQALTQQTDDEPYQVSGRSGSSNLTNNAEPIILGANANRRGQAELEALRLQVNAAAEEVDFASVKEPSIDERNNLLAAFQTALKDVEYEQSANQQVTQEKLDPIPRPTNQQIPKYGDLPASVQLQVPEFNINAHVYSSEPNNRWLNVDGVELQQGDMIQNKLTIVEIRPRDIVLEINGEQFRVPAI
ncbi:general secretion pathway protein GspB [Shewanella vesiculosa]|uniref:General secretion pathway protein GspB n=1 Tax=Shewanella vesiculosa TaxID=518738 RepID=A0ABV0FRK7_9GAMM